MLPAQRMTRSSGCYMTCSCLTFISCPFHYFSDLLTNVSSWPRSKYHSLIAILKKFSLAAAFKVIDYREMVYLLAPSNFSNLKKCKTCYSEILKIAYLFLRNSPSKLVILKGGSIFYQEQIFQVKTQQIQWLLIWQYGNVFLVELCATSFKQSEGNSRIF